MNLSAPFILRPVMTTLVTLTVFVLGLSAYFKLPVSSLPDVNYPTITVTVPFPGANPVTMANTVATPLEKQFMTIPGIKYVTSANTLGSTSVILQFEIDKNLDLAAVDVDAAIVAARPQLPPDLPQQPTFKKINPSATPIMYIAVTSPTMRQGELYDYANTFVGQRISIIEGVAQVLVYGSPSAVRAQVDPGQLAYLGITQGNVADALNNGNQYQPLGQFDGDYTASTIYDNGALITANAYDPLIVAYKNGGPVRLQDIATTVDSLQQDRAMRRYIDRQVDQPSVTLAVQRQPGANAVKVADAVRELIASISSQLPGALDLKIVFDRSLSIRESIADVQLTLLIAFLLVVLVIFIYLGKVRETIIPSLVMPMSIVATFAVIQPIGYTLDNLSLLALTLAIGFIIDDAIVVLENIVRRVEDGKAPLEASLEGSKQIGFTIVSMTLSLLAVFIPIIFMAGLIGKLFQEFAITLVIVTLASGIISLTLTPTLCRFFIPPHDQMQEGYAASLSRRLNDWMLKGYEAALSKVIHHRKTMLTIGGLSVIVSAILFKILPTDFIPDDDIGFLIAYTEAEQGTSSDQFHRYQQQVVNILKQQPAIESLISISSNPQYRQGLIFVSLVPKSERPWINELIQEWNQQLKNIPGVNTYLKNVPLIDLNVGPQVRGAYQYLMQGLQPKALYNAAEKLIQQMRDDPIFQGISTDLEVKTPQTNMEIQRDLAYSLGIDAQAFEQSLKLGFSGNRISRIQTPLDQYDVIVELNRDLQRNTSSLDSMYIASNTNQALVPLSAISTWNEGVGPASVNHFAQFPAVTITFNLAPGIALSDGIARLRQLANTALDSRVTGDVKGAAETFEEAMRSMAFLLVVTIFTIYVILGILYESFIHPITILSTIPPAIVGALLTLYFTGYSLSLYAWLGIVMLIGIVKKNGIMMVDCALDNVRIKGESPEKSIFDACLVRFRPIMMTTVATIMGALPIALAFGAGAESRRPLGFVIIGGMCVSQLITLFLTPVVYLYFEELRERMKGSSPP